MLLGDDLIVGNDFLEGGEGSDTFAISYTEQPITVDLNKAGMQPTGQGEDTIVGVENVEGSEFGDTLRGNAAVNELQGFGGNDTIEGRGGNDVLEGSTGTDTLGYAEAPAGVTVDLGANKASGGDGADTISGFENVTGSIFADVLTGSALQNTISALGGNDQVFVRDGGPDKVSCGAGTDSAVADRLTVDTIQSDCEQVDAIVDSIQGGGGSGGGSADVTPPRLVVSGARKQRLLKQHAVIIKLRCPDEACSVTVAGKGPGLKLKRVSRQLAAGERATVRLRLSARQLSSIRKLLEEGRRVRVKVTATASDAAGNAAPATMAISAKR